MDGGEGRRGEKILVVRLDALGDFVIWLDAARELRLLYPDAEITLLGNRSWQALAEQTGYFDRVWGMDRRRFVTDLRYRGRLLAQVRREGFDVLINPTFSRDFLWGDTLARVSGAGSRVCYHGDFSVIAPALMRLADAWYTRVVRSRPEICSELERNADFLRALGAEEFRAGLPRLPVFPGRPAGLPEGDYYVLVPGAGKEFRQWPVEHFSWLAQQLHARTGWTGIVVGSEQEQALGRRLEEEAGAPLQNWAGRTSLSDLIRVIANARLLVGNETSGLHIAAALGTPSVGLVGGGHYGRHVPYRPERPVRRPLPVITAHPMPCFGCDWQCIYNVPPGAPKPCIAGIAREDVWQAVQALLPAETLAAGK